MAVLEKIRNNAKLMVGFVGFALAAFVLGDALQNGNTWFSASQRVALSIDGEDVNIEDYERRLHTLVEQMQQRFGGQQLSDEQRMNINNSLTQQLIAEAVLNKLASQIGLHVTPDEVYALLSGDQGIAPAPMAAQFFASLGVNIDDAQAVNELIKGLSDKSIKAMPQERQASMRMLQAQWRNLQENIVTSRLQQKLQSLISRSYKITKLDQELALADGARTVALVRSTPMVGTDKHDSPSDEEVKKYYESHKNLFRSSEPSADISYISLQVSPSSEDYQAAEAEAQKAYSELYEAQATQVGDIVRNYNGSYRQAFLTGQELDQIGLSSKEIDFIKNAQVGATQNSGLISDKYSIVRLVDKKQGIASLGLKVIVLDSLMGTKTDSLLTALKAGASFEQMVEQYSQDPQSKSRGGLISQPGQYGITQDSFTEAQLDGTLFAEAYKKPIGEAFAISNGSTQIIIKAVNPGAKVDKYQVAQLHVDAGFSDKTYTAKFDMLNRILGAGGKFDDMITAAEKEGFSVSRNQSISTSSPQLGYIPSSRQLISWALNAEVGSITDKVYRVGTDYLMIAKVNQKHEAGFMPLSEVREQIVARLSSEKRVQNLVDSLSKKNLTDLEAYASELNTLVDTLVGVNYLVRGSEDAHFNGKVMTTSLGKLSQPFAAGAEVMIVQPLSKEDKDASEAEASRKQSEQGTGYQLSGRSLQHLFQQLKIQDNRARFY